MSSTKYDDGMVANALQAGKRVKGSKTRAVQLQGFQFDRWIELGIKPKKVIGLIFSTKNTATEASIAKQYAAYYKEAKPIFDALDDLPLMVT
ncbi:hypothetical protein ON010_g14858 [Phytophthora cinnamomi]|nr:hypothetical protein ON010_g14858 [Phytophthora cinnamomi]